MRTKLRVRFNRLRWALHSFALKATGLGPLRKWSLMDQFLHDQKMAAIDREDWEEASRLCHLSIKNLNEFIK